MELKINLDEKLKKYHKTWQFGLGNCHAYTLTRRDVFDYMKLAKKELGFNYLRFHGIFDDDMHIYQRLSDFPLFSNMEKADEIKEINFKQVGVILDNVLEAGFKPFIELSFMPSALASGDACGFHYKNNITLPKDFNKWAEFIKEFIYFLINRYGLEEIRTWYFEVWNEPDIEVIFFRGKKEDYFKLYEVTSKAIKEIDCKLKVGGPSTSGCLWLEDFVDFCNKENVPYDFVSTHHYPGDGFGNNFGKERFIEIRSKILEMAKNNTDVSSAMRSFFYHENEYKNYPESILKEKDLYARSIVKDKPLFITEWNSLAVYGADIHDEKASAAFIIKTCLETENICDGHMFWCLSDFFEEQFLIHKPFHGGFGLINNDGICKPNFYAFKILNSLYENRTDTKKIEDISYTCFVKDNKLQILFNACSNDYQKNETTNLNISLDSVAKKASVYYINDEYTNPKKVWTLLGSKNNLTKEEVKYIKKQSMLLEQKLDFEIVDFETKFNLEIKTNDTILVEMEFDK